MTIILTCNPPKFEYRPRPAWRWEQRANQTARSSFGIAHEPLEPIIEEKFGTLAVAVPDDPDIETPDVEVTDATDETPKTKVGATTPCIDCGHRHDLHHLRPEAHGDDACFYCITPHCSHVDYRSGVGVPCPCNAFRATAEAEIKLTKPAVSDHDLCLACGHFKIDHCSKAKPGKVKRLKCDKLAYRLLQAPDGTAYPCKHFSLSDPLCQCDSTSCSHSDDGLSFCICEKFISPFAKAMRAKVAKPRTAKAPKEKKPRARKQKTPVANDPLFPEESPDLDVNP